MIAGLVLGFGASKMLSLGGWTLLPWGIAAMVIGWLSGGIKSAIINGALYGFVLSFVFLLAGYVGNELLDKVPAFVLLGIFGGVCGLILSGVGMFLRSKFA